MGTKNNPGKYDCYAAAEPDEPIFVLLARDPLAPILVSIWSSLRYGDHEAADVKFKALKARALFRRLDAAKASEALDCAMDMFAWHKNNTSHQS